MTGCPAGDVTTLGWSPDDVAILRPFCCYFVFHQTAQVARRVTQ